MAKICSSFSTLSILQLYQAVKTYDMGATFDYFA